MSRKRRNSKHLCLCGKMVRGNRHVLRTDSKPQHNTTLAQCGEINLQQSFPGLSLVICHQFLLAQALITTTTFPDIFYLLIFRIIGKLHQFYQIGIILGHTFSIQRTVGNWLIQIITKKFYQALGTLTAQTDIIQVRPLWRGSTLYINFTKNKVVFLEPRDKTVII